MTPLLWMIHRGFDEHFAHSALIGIPGLSLGIVAMILTPFTAEENNGLCFRIK